MKLNKERNRWRTFSHQLKGAALGAVMIMGLSGTPLQALSIDLEGCRSGDNNGYALSGMHDADGIELYNCVDKSFTDGNMKRWAELDRVPHRIIIDSGGKVGDDLITFSYTVSGHFQGEEPIPGTQEKRGWNQITGLVLDEDLSDDACKLIQSNVTQTQDIYGPPGVEGAYTTLYRKVTVTNMPPATTCVALFNAELALGSHLYTGATLHFYLLNGDLGPSDGRKTVQVDVYETTGLSKEMIAVQDNQHLWSVSKTTDDSTVDFGDVCVDGLKEQEITFNVEWVKEPATNEGNVNVKTIITATNLASRALTVDLNDTIYDDATTPPTEIHKQEFGQIILEAGATKQIAEHMWSVVDTGNLQLRDEAVMTYLVAQNFGGVPLTLRVEETAIVTPSGDTGNVEATIKDHEWLHDIVMTDGSGTLTYAASEPTGEGGFDNGYIAGSFTANDVNWTSSIKSNGGSATFVKTFKLSDLMVISAKLSDVASLSSDNLAVGSNQLNFCITSTATFTLDITKMMPDVLQGDQVADFEFRVHCVAGEYDKVHPIHFAAGDTSKTISIPGLTTGEYTVTETAAPGFTPVTPSTQLVTLALPACLNNVNFENEVAVEPTVNVGKITLPAIIEGSPQDGGWDMTLWRRDLGSTGEYEVYSTLPNGTTAGTAVDPFPLKAGDDRFPEGEYKIEETMKAGWKEENRAGECEFTIDYPQDESASDYTCTFTNVKYAKIIVDKITDPSEGPKLFDFELVGTDTSVNFQLADRTTPFNSDNLMAGTYVVTEADPRPEFDLQSLVCVETGLVADPNEIPFVANIATIDLDWGETVTCTYTNKKRGTIEVIKYENDVTPPPSTWYFTLSGGDISGILDDNTTSRPLTFNGAQLIPGANYTLCETGISASWTTTWVIDGGTQVGDPYNPAMPVYVPLLEVSNEDKCIDFTASSNAGFKVTITVNNDAPEGDPRTIGYWKNWNTCTGGGQQYTAADNGGSAAGFWLLNDVLEQIAPIGVLAPLTCEDAVNILNKSEIVDSDKRNAKPKKRASDAAYGMAAQLIAAKANVAAQAGACTEAGAAITEADALLVTIDFDGTGAFLSPKDKSGQGARANELAGILDRYNNGELCTPTAP